MSNVAFFDRVAPAARKVAAATGLLPGVILTLMGEETGFGTSALAAQNNMTGIKWYGRSGTVQIAGGFSAYPTLDAWADDMIAVLHQPNMAVILQSAGQDASHQFTAFGESPYDGGTYQERMAWADRLMAVYTEQGLSAYDAAPAAASASGTWHPTVTGTGTGFTVDTTGGPPQAVELAAAVVGAVVLFLLAA